VPGLPHQQSRRKRIEECFGWLNTIALPRKEKHPRDTQNTSCISIFGSEQKSVTAPDLTGILILGNSGHGPKYWGGGGIGSTETKSRSRKNAGAEGSSVCSRGGRKLTDAYDTYERELRDLAFFEFRTTVVARHNRAVTSVLGRTAAVNLHRSSVQRWAPISRNGHPAIRSGPVIDST
jgi:hypothetical protein